MTEGTGFWWFLFVCNLMIPILMILLGKWMWKHCPESINVVLGYRTKRSMKNMDTWKFAHEYCGKLWWKLGWISLLPTIVVQIPFFYSNEDVIGTVGSMISTVQVILLMVSVFPTEAALKKTFHEDGTRRT